MNALEIFETVIVIEALGLTLFVLAKLWYYDVYLTKTSITKRVEAFLKYGMFMRSLLFTFIYIFSLFMHKMVALNNPSSAAIPWFSIVGNISLIFFSYTLFKISSKTYGRWSA